MENRGKLTLPAKNTEWNLLRFCLMNEPRGYTGRESFCYVAYAGNATGANFSLDPANHLKYRAEIHTDTAIAEPTTSARCEIAHNPRKKRGGA